ncbi:MAG: CBS domain-containing protein [Candidatus Omnitrophica bacterium]|nr:CBS domain-containing protein [Candidatus Omnitrophota bacterium]
MVAKDIMTKDVQSVDPLMQIREFAAFLIKENVSGAPVVDAKGNFLGIATEEDLIFQDKKVNLPTFLNLFSNIIPLGIARTEEELRRITGTDLKDVMQENPQVISPEMSIEEIATIMSENKTYYLTVIEDDKVVGVVTKRDLIRAVAKGNIW